MIRWKFVALEKRVNKARLEGEKYADNLNKLAKKFTDLDQRNIYRGFEDIKKKIRDFDKLKNVAKMLVKNARNSQLQAT